MGDSTASAYADAITRYTKKTRAGICTNTSYLSELEIGKKELSLTRISRISKGFGISISQLTRGIKCD